MKKGFTLVEMLAVITILGLIITIVVPKALEAIASSKNKSYAEQLERIENIAETYATENSYDLHFDYYGVTAISFQDLIDLGYLEAPIYNPKTNIEFDYEESYVEITRDSGNYSYKVYITDGIAPVPAGSGYAYSIVPYTYQPATNLMGINCDDCYQELVLGFSFPMNGTSYNSVYVGSNGIITFEPSEADSTGHDDLMARTSSNPIISLYWHDLDVNNILGSGVYYDNAYDNGLEYMIIEYRNVYDLSYSSSGYEGSFEVRLYSNGDILMSYLDVFFRSDNGYTGANYGSSATTGVYENTSSRAQYSYNQGIISDSTSILYSKN
mgnify:CR=1 FL=1